MTAIAAWLAGLASYALMIFQGVTRVMHPHFFPLISMMLFGFAAGIAAAGLGVWRIIRGPGRLAAVGWLCFAVIPMLLWIVHATFALGAVRTANRPLDLRLKLASVAAAAVTDGLARLVYPKRLAGEHTVMVYDDCDDPEADVAAMDRHIEQVGRVLGRPLPTTVHWVRGGLFGLRGLSFNGIAFLPVKKTEERESRRPSYPDRHEVAHNVRNDQLPFAACPPTVFNEGWAESQSVTSLMARAQDFWYMRKRGWTLSVRQLVSPEWYYNGESRVYYQGGNLVDFLVRRYGAEKFFTLCATCRPQTIADDCLRIYGADLDQLDELFWADQRELAFGKGPPRRKSISGELGLAMDGPNDESAQKEFLDRYPKEVKKLKEAYRHVRMSVSREPKAAADADRPGGSKIELVRDGDRSRLTYEIGDYVRVFVATPQCVFILGKSRAEARFSMERASPDAPYAATLGEIRAWELEVDAPCGPLEPEVEPQYRPFYDDFQEWMNLPGFAITRAVRVQDGARRLVKVYFEHEFPDDEEPMLKAGWILFRADQSWAIDAYEVRTKGLPAIVRLAMPKKDRAKESKAISIQRATVRYRGTHQGVPVLESVEWNLLRDGTPVFARTARITDIRFGAAPDAAFDLASFDADPPPRQGESHAAATEDIFVRLTRWLVRAIWLCTAGVVLAIALPLVHRAVGKRPPGADDMNGQ